MSKAIAIIVGIIIVFGMSLLIIPSLGIIIGLLGSLL